MRIVGGRFRGKKLIAPEGADLRPTSDRARESVFNILAHGKAAIDLDGITVVDMFCGTGALGLEAMSRGAAHGVFADRNPAHLKIAKDNAAAMGLWRECLMLGLECTHLAVPPRAAKTPAGLAFLDPPYGQGLADPTLRGLVNKGWLAPGAIVVVEVGAEEALRGTRGFEVLDERTYGAAKVYFLRWPGPTS
ncbi:MAG: 16S rRNA (guanine(966)-N(2))-methyltransferase RsmD [Rhodospirillales bacterium CG15_BIG_FIL_POST_REV_8_21_14_020_66_15]|nr:MAG: 16S rRNA (guanine(966)-N(2))-methyltransferase RsmD [Rhodospirillales bacterium CG15_BIG_FIL_POST_REV_8_21_14_020_66_15]